jgi:hypothetical protein
MHSASAAVQVKADFLKHCNYIAQNPVKAGLFALEDFRLDRRISKKQKRRGSKPEKILISFGTAESRALLPAAAKASGQGCARLTHGSRASGVSPRDDDAQLPESSLHHQVQLPASFLHDRTQPVVDILLEIGRIAVRFQRCLVFILLVKEEFPRILHRLVPEVHQAARLFARMFLEDADVLFALLLSAGFHQHIDFQNDHWILAIFLLYRAPPTPPERLGLAHKNHLALAILRVALAAESSDSKSGLKIV